MAGRIIFYDDQVISRLAEEMSQHITKENPQGLLHLPPGMSSDAQLRTYPNSTIAPSERAIVHEPEFEHYPGKIKSSLLALRGLFVSLLPDRALTENQRRERSCLVQDRIRIARHVGNRLNNPRETPGDPKELISWPRLHTTDRTGPLDQTETYEGDYDHIAEWLLGWKKLPSGGSRQPNLNRPVTRAARKASDNINRIHEKRLVLQNEKRWLVDSYPGRTLDSRTSTHRLTPAEKRHRGKISRRIRKLDRKTDNLTRKFNKVAGSTDWRSKVARHW